MDSMQARSMRKAFEKLAVTEDWIRARLADSGEMSPQSAVRLRQSAVRASPRVSEMAAEQGLVGQAAPEGSALSKRRAFVRAANQRASAIEGQVYPKSPGRSVRAATGDVTGAASPQALSGRGAPTRSLGGLAEASTQPMSRAPTGATRAINPAAAASDDVATRATRAVRSPPSTLRSAVSAPVAPTQGMGKVQLPRGASNVAPTMSMPAVRKTPNFAAMVTDQPALQGIRRAAPKPPAPLGRQIQRGAGRAVRSIRGLGTPGLLAAGLGAGVLGTMALSGRHQAQPIAYR
jgi:hypothetical protein